MDFARFTAMASVVLLHSADQIMIYHQDVSIWFWSIYEVIRIIGRTGVPVFIMLSGALVLPVVHKVPIIQFYIKKIPHLIFLLIFYFFLTNYVDSIVSGYKFDILKMIDSLSSGDMQHAYQLWFLYPFIGLYLVAPFVGRLVSVLETKDILVYIALGILLCFITSTTYILSGKNAYYSSVGNDFLGVYITYFVVGYVVVNRNILERIKASSIGLLLLLALLALVMVINVIRDNTSISLRGDFSWYNNIGTFITSVLFFCLLSKAENTFDTRSCVLFGYLGKASIGIFLLHVVFLNMVLYETRFMTNGVFQRIFIVLFLTYTSSLLFYAVLKRFKYTRMFVS